MAAGTSAAATSGASAAATSGASAAATSGAAATLTASDATGPGVRHERDSAVVSGAALS